MSFLSGVLVVVLIMSMVIGFAALVISGATGSGGRVVLVCIFLGVGSAIALKHERTQEQAELRSLLHRNPRLLQPELAQDGSGLVEYSVSNEPNRCKAEVWVEHGKLVLQWTIPQDSSCEQPFGSPS